MIEDVLLSIALPYSQDPKVDLQTARASWKSLVDHNSSLVGCLKAVMLLSISGNPILEIVATEISSKGLKVYSFTDENWGRILNDAFLFCLASDKVS